MRVAFLILIAACSSAKQTDEPSPPSHSTSVAPQPARGSSADPSAAKPGDPAAELTSLRADVDVMCNAAKVTGGKTFNEVGPHIAENMQTHHKVELFADFRTTTLDEIIVRMRRLMAKANVTQCDTVDVLIANDPRKESQD